MLFLLFMFCIGRNIFFSSKPLITSGMQQIIRGKRKPEAKVFFLGYWYCCYLWWRSPNMLSASEAIKKQ